MVWQSNKALLVFLAVSSGIFYAILISFAEALTQRILQAHYYKSRRQIKSKWRHILGGRSKCDHCEKKLNAVNLVPVFGYWLSGRKCDNCGNAIKARYWLSELAAFVYGTIVFWLYPDITYALTTGAYLVILHVIMRIDWEYMLIPTEAILTMLILGLLDLLNRFYGYTTTATLSSDISLHLLISFSWFFLLHLIRILSRYRMGLADVRLTLALCFGLGYPLAVFLPTVASALGLVFYLLSRLKPAAGLVKNDRGLKTQVAFGVFLGLAFLLLRAFKIS